MNNDILDRLNDTGKRWSKGQKRIAAYIRDSYDKAAFMTAAKLGSTVGVSESTVVRFATSIGYEGYPEMRRAMQEMVRSRMTSVQRIEVAGDMMDGSNALKTVMESDIGNLQSTLEKLDSGSFSAAVYAIETAKHLYIVGMRSSMALASFLGFYMNLLVENVRTIQDTTANEVFEQLMHIGPGDVYIGISYPRYSSGSYRAMEFARRRGATVIAITDNDSSPFAQLAHIRLFAGSDMVSFLDSLVAPMSLINALIVAVAARKRDNLEQTFNYLEGLWSEYEVFITDES